MRVVPYTDEKGYLRQGIIRDTDPDSMAPKGIPLGPPDLSRLNCDAILREVHELLIQREIYTWQDVQTAQNAVGSAVSLVVKRHVIALYRMEEKQDEQQLSTPG